MNAWLLRLSGLLVITSCVQCAKILGVFPMASPSHYFIGNSILRALAEKGHDVTMVSPFIEKNPPKNGSYRDIVLTGFIEEHEKMVKDMNLFEMGKVSLFVLLPMFAKMIVGFAELPLNHTKVQELLHSDEKFDAVIVEQFMNEAHKAFAHHFDAPLILASTIGANSWVNPLVGNPTPISYVPDTMTGFSSTMTFYQRMSNSFLYLLHNCINYFYAFPMQAHLVNTYFPKKPKLEDLMYNVSIVLLNSHPSTNQPVPYVPNMIDIGGIHVKPPKKLPEDLQTFLDNAKDGVIYFSMGSNLKSSQLPQDKREALLNTFSKLKQKVLWKWEEDVLPGQPPNVRLGKWLPQQDILAHPNVKLFITHGGLLSTTETIYHGMPVLAIPVTADQKLNAARIADEGLGLKLDYADVSEVTLTEKLNELLTNPKYYENAKQKSELFHDRLVSPSDAAVYWVEYAIRHKGATHLRVAGIDLPWYKYFLLDVILVVSVGSVFLLYLTYHIFRKLLSLCYKSKTQKLKVN